MLNLARVLNYPFPQLKQTYTERDTILYALGIGFGADGDVDDLPFIYEKGLVAFPTMPIILCNPGPWTGDATTGIDRKLVLFGEQKIILHRTVPVSGAVSGTTKVVGVVDKGVGRGALIYTVTEIVDSATGEKIATLDATTFCRGDGGCGGTSNSIKIPPAIPVDPAHKVTEILISPGAAFLYRLSGDLNPLHIDPEYARLAGFPRPILHGVCTFGMVARAVLKSFPKIAISSVRELEVRFTGPVFPGERLKVEMWRGSSDISFRATAIARNQKVLDFGRIAFAGGL
jgi:acyl dehydratase